MPWWAWLVTGFLLLGVEVLTVTFGVMFFGVSAILLGFMLWAGVTMPPWVQWLVFSSLSVLSLALFRRPLMQRWKVNERRDLDTMVGEQAVATEDIPPHGSGRAELRGSVWNVRNAGPKPLLRGEKAVVSAVEGITLVLEAR